MSKPSSPTTSAQSFFWSLLCGKGPVSSYLGTAMLLLGIVVLAISGIDKLESVQVHNINIALASLLQNLGTTLIVTGVIGVWYGIHDNLEYFRARIREVFFEREFLTRLSDKQLQEVVYTAMSALKRSKHVGHDEGFLNYLFARSFRSLALPYKEDYHYKVEIKKVLGGFEISESITYFACPVTTDEGTKQMEQIDWVVPEEEYEKTAAIFVMVSGQDTTDYNCIKYDRLKDLNPTRQISEGKPGYQFRVLIPKKISASRFGVEIVHKYQRKDLALFDYCWRSPTHRLKMTVAVPARYVFRSSVFGVESSDSCWKQLDGSYAFSTETWLPPRSGFAFSVTPET